MTEIIKKLILILAAMGGVLLDKINSERIFLLAFLVFIYFAFRWLHSSADFLTAILVFLFYFSIRYLFLFLSFIDNGIAFRLKRRFGEEKGFEIYRIITAAMFFTGGMSFSLMIIKSGVQISTLQSLEASLNIIGIALAATGIVINVWSTWLVGIDVYYYKDLFLGRKIAEFKNEGPYKIFSNPMYGPGQANGYGTALTYGSIEGILGMFLNQVMMYIFFFTIEKPHIIRILEQSNESSLLKSTG